MSELGQKCPKVLRLPAGKNTHEHMRRIVPNPDSRTAMNRCAFKRVACAAVRVRSISRSKGNFANKSLRTPVETRLGL